jgi:hypothetical protein
MSNRTICNHGHLLLQCRCICHGIDTIVQHNDERCGGMPQLERLPNGQWGDIVEESYKE